MYEYHPVSASLRNTTYEYVEQKKREVHFHSAWRNLAGLIGSKAASYLTISISCKAAIDVILSSIHAKQIFESISIEGYDVSSSSW